MQAAKPFSVYNLSFPGSILLLGSDHKRWRKKNRSRWGEVIFRNLERFAKFLVFDPPVSAGPLSRDKHSKSPLVQVTFGLFGNCAQIFSDPVNPSVPIEGGLPVTPLWFVDWVNLQWNKIKITESHKRRHLKTKILKSRFVWRFGANHESWPSYQMFLFHHRLQKGNLASPSLILHFMTFSWHEMKAILDLEQNLLT